MSYQKSAIIGFWGEPVMKALPCWQREREREYRISDLTDPRVQVFFVLLLFYTGTKYIFKNYLCK